MCQGLLHISWIVSAGHRSPGHCLAHSLMSRWRMSAAPSTSPTTLYIQYILAPPPIILPAGVVIDAQLYPNPSCFSLVASTVQGGGGGGGGGYSRDDYKNPDCKHGWATPAALLGMPFHTPMDSFTSLRQHPDTRTIFRTNGVVINCLTVSACTGPWISIYA